LDSAEVTDKDGRHFWAGHVPGGEDKRSSAGKQQGLFLVGTATDSFVFGQKNPRVFHNIGQPLRILGIRCEMIAVQSEIESRAAKSLDDRLAFQAAVEKENERLMRT
jgi:hypothetical protein